MKCSKVLDWIATILLFIGGLNWGLIGLIHSNLVQKILGTMPTFERAIYIIVGLSAIYMLIRFFCGCSKGSQK